MIFINKKIYPCSAKEVRLGKGRKGRCTQFAIPMFHMDDDERERINDGFLGVLAMGRYDFVKGDAIIIRKIGGAELRTYKGKQYFSLYASVELVKSGRNDKLVDANIPDDL